ncbi:hypothetical protein SAMN04488134_11361 [Amphibacillus marinus]|uniref:Uncharacterized protein n=1 Tax=Amphibacillus marinus TaxID=872970 RepID=A0A1H8SQE9_9BACI|nr:hypothetical protein [Amphibacillus marinus]SEO80568.1 hypothetical protein SAMN04488134_11361 [Amphibacillus marinus]
MRNKTEGAMIITNLKRDFFKTVKLHVRNHHNFKNYRRLFIFFLCVYFTYIFALVRVYIENIEDSSYFNALIMITMILLILFIVFEPMIYKRMFFTYADESDLYEIVKENIFNRYILKKEKRYEYIFEFIKKDSQNWFSKTFKIEKTVSAVLVPVWAVFTVNFGANIENFIILVFTSIVVIALSMFGQYIIPVIFFDIFDKKMLINKLIFYLEEYRVENINDF